MTGQEFVKMIRPLGAAIFLIVGILFVIICFRAGSDPIPGYESPRGAEYYSQDAGTLNELKAELEQNVFPKLEGVAGCRVGDGVLIVTIESDSFAVTRSAILQYFDRSLFEFAEG
jgi:hypothetical protein